MKSLVLGAGMMGRAIAYDLHTYSHFDTITVADHDTQTLRSAENFLSQTTVDFMTVSVTNAQQMLRIFQNYDVVISAVPYKFNYHLTQFAIETKTHFLDLGGNNTIVEKQQTLSAKAKKQGVTIIPDCGLAPGITSVITRDIVQQLDSIDSVKIRVGGLPLAPQPPLHYQIVFSPYGLINEYVEDALILQNGKIIKKQSMSELETVSFDEPFGNLEAFLTSGGCSTLPYTYRNTINYLDYKTIRYPGHCEKFKTFIDLGLTSTQEISVAGHRVIPRDYFATLLMKYLPHNEKDVVLLKVFGRGIKKGQPVELVYTMIDYYDEKNDITAMMRTTGYPVSIIAQMIAHGTIKEHGVFGSEEIVPCEPFFKELEKRNIKIIKKIVR